MDAAESPKGQKADAAKPSRRRNWKRLCVAGVLALAVFCSIRFMSAGPHGISERAYERIQLGMTEEEATDLIGFPPSYASFWEWEGGFPPQRKAWERLSWEGDPVEIWPNWLWWQDQDISIQLLVDDGGKVVGKGLWGYQFRPLPAPDPVWLRWLKRLLP